MIWDPKKISERARSAVDWMFRWMGTPLSEGDLDAFQDQILMATPTNYSSATDTRPTIQHASGLTVIYDNGVNGDTKPYQNVPSLLFSGATFEHHRLAQLLTEYGRCEQTGPHTFRIVMDASQLILGTGCLLQRPIQTPLPKEIYRP